MTRYLGKGGRNGIRGRIVKKERMNGRRAEVTSYGKIWIGDKLWKSDKEEEKFKAWSEINRRRERREMGRNRL